MGVEPTRDRLAAPPGFEDRTPHGSGEPQRKLAGWTAVAEGAAHVRERRPAWNALAAIGVHRFAYGISTIATILLCRNHFNDPADVIRSNHPIPPAE